MLPPMMDLETVTSPEVREMTPFGRASRAARALAAEVVVLVASNCVVSASVASAVEVVPPVADLR